MSKVVSAKFALLFCFCEYLIVGVVMVSRRIVVCLARMIQLRTLKFTVGCLAAWPCLILKRRGHVSFIRGCSVIALIRADECIVIYLLNAEGPHF
jgi:hypothetical protein